MAAALGYRLDQIRPFLTSLRRTGYAGSIVLLADRSLRRQLRGDPVAVGVTVLRSGPRRPSQGVLAGHRMQRVLWSPLRGVAWTMLRALQRAPIGEPARLAVQRCLADLVWAPMEARFVHFRGFLRRRPYRRVVISDVRDVLFQTDPFQALPPHGLGVSIETDRYTIATETHNAQWLQRIYGTAMLAQLGDHPVSCVGVTTGDGPSMDRYLRLVGAELLRLDPRAIGVAGADTAIHNMLLWTGKLEPAHRLRTLASPIMTINALGAGEVAVSVDGRALNLDGTPASIVHQYDRLPTLGQALLRALA